LLLLLLLLLLRPTFVTTCLQIWQVTPKTKPKTYTFYFEGQGIAAARSSAGGLALLRK
jgi:hypothetical protein